MTERVRQPVIAECPEGGSTILLPAESYDSIELAESQRAALPAGIRDGASRPDARFALMDENLSYMCPYCNAWHVFAEPPS